MTTEHYHDRNMKIFPPRGFGVKTLNEARFIVAVSWNIYFVILHYTTKEVNSQEQTIV